MLSAGAVIVDGAVSGDFIADKVCASEVARVDCSVSSLMPDCGRETSASCLMSDVASSTIGGTAVGSKICSVDSIASGCEVEVVLSEEGSEGSESTLGFASAGTT